METVNYGRDKFYDTGPGAEVFESDKRTSLLCCSVIFRRKRVLLNMPHKINIIGENVLLKEKS